MISIVYNINKKLEDYIEAGKKLKESLGEIESIWSEYFVTIGYSVDDHPLEGVREMIRKLREKIGEKSLE